MAKEKKEESKELDDIIKKANKDFGEGAITYGSEELGMLGSIPFGILSLDILTGIGGVAKGRITELHGMDGCFKSTLALYVVAECQKQGGTCAFIDAEFAFLPEYGQQLGVDVDKLILVHPSSAEECFTIIEQMVDSGKVSLIVLDSLAALSPETEKANDFGSANIGVMARLVGQFFRKITSKLGKTETTLIVLNQLRESLNGMFPVKVTPAGNALRFYASLRLECSKHQIKEEKEVRGIKLIIKSVKNKLYKPYLNTELEAYFGEGIDKIKDLINVGIAFDVIKSVGAGWLTIDDIKLQGLDKMKQHLLDNPEYALDLETRIKQKINNK